MTDKVYSIDEIKATVEPIAKQYGAERVYLFGSYARGEATANSDLDFLIDCKKAMGLKLANMFGDLEEIFDKPVDILTVKAITNKSILQHSIDMDKVMIYEFN